MIVERLLPAEYKRDDIVTILKQHNIQILCISSDGYLKLEGTVNDLQDAKTAILALVKLQRIDA